MRVFSAVETEVEGSLPSLVAREAFSLTEGRNEVDDNRTAGLLSEPWEWLRNGFEECKSVAARVLKPVSPDPILDINLGAWEQTDQHAASNVL